MHKREQTNTRALDAAIRARDGDAQSVVFLAEREGAAQQAGHTQGTPAQQANGGRRLQTEKKRAASTLCFPEREPVMPGHLACKKQKDKGGLSDGVTPLPCNGEIIAPDL